MKKYKSVNKLIKSYVHEKYGDEIRLNSVNEKVDNICYKFLDDFLHVLKKYHIIRKYVLEIENNEDYKKSNLTGIKLYYNLPDEDDDKFYIVSFLF